MQPPTTKFITSFFSLYIMTTRKKRMLAEQSLYETEQGRVLKPDVYGTRKKLIRQNQQLYNQHNDDDFGDDIPVDSDTITTAEYLIRSNSQCNTPICFVHQIYSILPNNTVADRELVKSLYMRERVQTKSIY